MPLDLDDALQGVLERGDEWESWRALRLGGDSVGDPPAVPGQDGEGGFLGPSGRASPGATGEALCHFVVLGLAASAPACIAADWLQDARTPAEAWLDSPDDVPGDLDTLAGARVWATASATCGLLALARDPGQRALDLLRGEADMTGRFTGGPYPTFAAAGAYWLAQGAKTEMAEWALRWSRETLEEWWGPWEAATALTFWGAAGLPAEHPSVELVLDTLQREAPSAGWPEVDLTLRVLELIHFFED